MNITSRLRIVINKTISDKCLFMFSCSDHSSHLTVASQWSLHVRSHPQTVDRQPITLSSNYHKVNHNFINVIRRHNIFLLLIECRDESAAPDRTREPAPTATEGLDRRPLHAWVYNILQTHTHMHTFSFFPFY